MSMPVKIVFSQTETQRAGWSLVKLLATGQKRDLDVPRGNRHVQDGEAGWAERHVKPTGTRAS